MSLGERFVQLQRSARSRRGLRRYFMCTDRPVEAEQALRVCDTRMGKGMVGIVRERLLEGLQCSLQRCARPLKQVSAWAAIR
jgi:hypothetical protein